MHEVDEGGLVRERGLNFMAPAGLEDEASLSAVDTDLFDIGIGEMLSEWTKRRHCREYPPPELLRLCAIRRRQGASLLLSNHAPNELIDPDLVIDSQARAVAAGQLGCEFGLDACADVRLDSGSVPGHHGHAGAAEPASG
jgi:hypothetical protein